VPVAAINNTADLVASPQLAARGYFVTAPHPASDKPLLMPGAPYKLDLTPWRLRCPAPALGQHNQEVYGALGLDAARLTRLHALGVI
jgi:crotonobetainyl-CoA:carnitine CoA-transferase CaiB-like acyl-CoA transferase